MAVLELEAVESAAAPPGPELAAELAARDPAALNDVELVESLAAFRRLASWAQAGELAAAAELARRRPMYPYERPFGDGEHSTEEGAPITEFVVDEVRAALTLTGNAAVELIELGLMLGDRLPATGQELRAGRIDLPKARVIARGTTGAAATVARTVERRVLPKAPVLTTGELRARVAREVLAADPAAADHRRKAAEATRAVSLRLDEQGTAVLAGSNLPADQAIAAANRLNAIARAFKADGDERRLDNIRADVFLAMLLGLLPNGPTAASRSVTGDAPRGSKRNGRDRAGMAPRTSSLGEGARSGGPGGGEATGSADGAGRDSSGDVSPEGESGEIRPWYEEVAEEFGVAGVAAVREAELAARAGAAVGTVHLTIPFLTYVGLASHPGHVAGYGPVLADVARMLADSADARETRWCVTVVDADGEPIAHGETRYRPSARMQALVECRDQTCRFPGCRRAAHRCDLDHTIPHDQDGPTCPCNLAPLCRRHHRLKQREGWELEQISPGVLIWSTPTGHCYVVHPDPYPRE